MKGFKAILAIGLVIALIITSASIAMAQPNGGGKPLDVIKRSNGFPSGQHFNLNLHGKKCSYEGTSNDSNVVIIPLYSSCNTSVNSTIEYFSNKRNFRDLVLDVIDSLTEHFDGDPAQVYLPYNILDESDNRTRAAGGYYVYGRILGTPNNGSGDNVSSIILSQNMLFHSDNFTNNFTDNSTWPYDPVDDEFLVGLIDSKGNLYSANATHFERFDPPTDDPNEKGGNKAQKKGKSKAVDISPLFWWTGLVADNATYPDSNGNGIIDIEDLYLHPTDNWSDWDTKEPWGEITWEEFVPWAESYGATYHDGVWIFEIADMVISRQTIINDGTRNYQIRFYPKATTTFG